ncbi:hypothetical protein [Glycomyces xiaoerkulensis]|uniref:hypothetical protein n=1 Tax=Glycomyces xiaoerkulensis TaxID=2038139 RepID=UPI00130012DC|nr:hypothetical protein [Glycomyces xiaoerkulensis]
MMTSRAFLKRHLATGALLVVWAAVGCGTTAESAADASASNPDPSASTTTSSSPSSDATSTPAPPSPSAGASETSGTESTAYESCSDGECEVSFSDSVEFPLGGSDGQWTVEAAVEDDGVRVNLTKPSGLGGGGGLLYHPACTLATNAGGGGSLSCAEEGEELPEPEAGGIVVHLLELTKDTAVVQAVLG